MHRARNRAVQLRCLVSITLSAGLAVAAVPSVHASAPDPGTRIPAFSATPEPLINDELRFPTTPAGQSSTSVVTVENQGDSPLTIGSMVIKGFGRADYAISNNTCVTSLDPGSTCTLHITFTPTKDGENLASLQIGSDATATAVPGPGLRSSGFTYMSLAGFGYGTCPDQPFASGTGTTQDPYVIETIAQFNCISATTESGWRDYFNKAFVLGNDLDGQGLEGAIRPVGNWNKAFTGTFDGQGFSIHGFTVDDVWAGLFPWLGTGASVHDLVIQDANVSTVFEGGILSAYSDGAEFTDIVIDGGSLTASAGNANGGAIGFAYGGTMSRIFSSAAVAVRSREGGAQVGGLFGVVEQIAISESAATGSVSVTFDDVAPNGVPTAGGFAGAVWGSTISDSLATGAVTIVNSASGTFYGGFAGSVEEAGSLIERSYSTGAVTMSGDGVTGGFIGRTYQAPDPATTSVLWDIETSGQVVGIGDGDSQTTPPQGMTSEAMRSPASYIGWAIEQAPVRGATWTLLDDGPPVLSWRLLPSIGPSAQTVTGTVGTAISATAELSAAWFSGAVLYTVSPQLPSGLSLNATTGVISGTPTAVTASTVHTITGTGATTGIATATVTVSVVAAQAPAPAPAPSSTSTSSATSGGAVVAANAPAPTAPSTGAPVMDASRTQLPAGITLVSTTNLGTPRVIRALATSLVDAPKVAVKAGAPVNVTVRGFVPGAPYEVRMRTGKGRFTSMGTSVAGGDGSMRLPAWSARKGVKATIAVVGPDGQASYLKVNVAPQERAARARR